jgi:catechol 2,3-dioxygenase
LREVARLDGPERDIVGGELAFLSFGSSHHDMALLESPQTRPADPACAGLAHVALRIGDHIDTLRAFHAHLRQHGVALAHSRDHEVSQSLYLRDPDGLLIEVYVDADPALWAARPEAVATVRPLRVDWLN